MLTRVTLGTKPKSPLLYAPQFRTYKKEKITPEKIAEAKKKQARQTNTFVDRYYQKWGRKKILGDKENKKKLPGDDDDEDEENSSAKDITVNEFRMWNAERRREHLDFWQEGNDPCLSVEAKIKASELHLAEPHYWTPVRLSALFKTNVEYMRCLLFDAKIAAEAKALGPKFIADMDAISDLTFVAGRAFEVDKEELEEIKAKIPKEVPPWDDWEIDKGFANIFGTVDFPDQFSDPPEDIPIRKIHNPWYFVDPGLKSGELLKFIRARETRHYRECSRIPQREYPKMSEYKEILGRGIEQRKFPNKKTKWVMYDSSPHYDLYNRPILIRDHDNTWRGPTWAERRQVFMSRKQVRYPTKIPFVYPDETQPDRRSIRHKPPASFSFYNPGHDFDKETYEDYGRVSWTQEEEGINSDREFVRKCGLADIKAQTEGMEIGDENDGEENEGDVEGDVDDFEEDKHPDPFPFQSKYQTKYEM